MREELEKKLYTDYPKIFIQKDMNMTQTCMCWGIECGDGWYDLINNLCKDLNYINEKYDIQTIATQVKEKFGTLRFYYITELGKKWVVKTRIWAKILNKILLFLKIYRCRINEYEYFFEGKKYITKQHGNWICYGRKMEVHSGVHDLISDIIEKYSDFSSQVCELCGSTVNVTSTQGYISYLCATCKKDSYNGGN